MRETITFSRVLTLCAVAALTLAAPAAASQKGATSGGPTLVLQKHCVDYPPNHRILSTFVGFPPNTPYFATFEGPGGTGGSGQLTSGPNGEFFVVDPAVDVPGTWTFTIVWAGGTIRASINVDCSIPQSKQECTDGAWRNYPQFKNQGQCIAFVNRGS
jgi:hypothetical protein